MQRNRIIGGSIANCVHIAGIYQFLRIAQDNGHKTKFLGAAVKINKFINEIKSFEPDIVCVSYRLTASSLKQILKDFFKTLAKYELLEDKLFYFGGTPECVEVAKQFSYFACFFQGEEDFSVINSSLDFVNKLKKPENKSFKASLFDLKIKNTDTKNRYVLPLIRHHFGLPDLEETIKGIKKIAKAKVVDVISIATDQNAQEYFFEPEKMNKKLSGAGGVPIRSEEDLERIYQASRTGNFPKLRIYSGTKNLLKWAKLSVRTINNAWGAIPLFWYSELDGRSNRKLEKAIAENMEVIKWYAEKNIPVEVNDPHHWSLRESADVTAVFDAYLSAYNAKKLGVKKYIVQLMLNTPRLTTPKMDLAKMLAKIELIKELEDENFSIIKQVRAGLTHFSTDMNIAKGQLAASTVLAIALKPEIIHVVSFSEANHAANANNVIESCKIVKGVIRNMWKDFPDFMNDKKIIDRKNYLKNEAVLLKNLSLNYFNDDENPLTIPRNLAELVKTGFLDAPQLKGNPVALGEIKTMPKNGAYDLVDESGKKISITEYIKKLQYLK